MTTGTSATRFVLQIQHGRVVVIYRGTHGGEHTRVVTSERDFADFLTSKAAEARVAIGELDVLCSSTLDFPDEFTTNRDTIALARALRGN